MFSSSLFKITLEATGSLQGQLRDQITTAILNAEIPLDTPLPSTRALAKALGISRNTVILTYEYLVDNGYLVSRQRSGYYVNPAILKQYAKTENAPQSSPSASPNWNEHLTYHPSKSRLNKLHNWRAFPYPFIYGQLDHNLFPHHKWRSCCKESLHRGDINSWQCDLYDEDDPLLIEQIRTRLLPKRGIKVSAQEILITVGTQHALYMLLQLLLTPSRTLGVEQPGYPDVVRIAERTGATIKHLQLDQAGLVVNEQLNECQLVFTTPSHQFPTTVTMPIRRRQDLLKSAAEQDFLLIEDDYEAEINFGEHPTVALKSLDQHNRVIYMGSLSKTLSPGLRVGYVVADVALIQELREYRRMMLRHPPANNQRTVGLFLSHGYYDTLQLQLMEIYQERWSILGQALATHLPGMAEPSVYGGSAFWIKAMAELDTVLMKQKAAEQGILVESGQTYYVDKDCPMNYFRLGFSSISTRRIAPGIEKLANVIDTMLQV